MATLSIKNVPDALVKRLKSRAATNRRSLNLEVIACLEQVTRSVPLDPQTILARARAVRVQPRIPITDRLLARLKAEGRP